MTLSVQSAKSYIRKHDIMSLMLSIAQSSTNYVLAARFYVFAVQKPAIWLVKKLLPESLLNPPAATNVGEIGWDQGKIMTAIAEFTIASSMIFVVSTMSKSTVSKLPYVVQIQPTGFYQMDTALSTGSLNPFASS